MKDALKSRLLDGLKSPVGNRLAPVRWAKEALLFANDLAGRPLRPLDKIDLDDAPTADSGNTSTTAPATGAAREQAPVMLYKDWNSRHDLKRITDVLTGAGIRFEELDVTDDEATHAWVMATSKVQALPAVYIAGEAIGGYHELAQLDVSGQLRKKVFGS